MERTAKQKRRRNQSDGIQKTCQADSIPSQIAQTGRAFLKGPFCLFQLFSLRCGRRHFQPFVDLSEFDRHALTFRLPLVHGTSGGESETDDHDQRDQPFGDADR